MDERTVKAKADYGMDVLEAHAGQWAVEIDLTSMIKNIVSPMRLSRRAPNDVREKLTHRMEVQIDAIIRQAYVEGAFRTICKMQDERREMRKRSQTSGR